MKGERSPPVVVAAVHVPANSTSTDSSRRIQAAIDAVSALPRNASTGHRGAVVLGPGVFRVNTTLRISTSGVVLRGAGAGGAGSGGTTVLATARPQHPRACGGVRSCERSSGFVLLRAAPAAAVALAELPGRVTITDRYVPTGATTLGVASVAGFSVGDLVVVARTSTSQWITSIGMDSIPNCQQPTCNQWQPSQYELKYERSVVEVLTATNRLRLDYPLVHPIDQTMGGGNVYRAGWSGNRHRLQNIGVEDIKFDSVYTQGQETSDEDHAWYAVQLDSLEHSWVRRVACHHFGFSCVSVERWARHVTVSNCSNYDMVSIVTGGRRYSFNLEGTLCLFTNCHSRGGRHDFVTGSRVTGPNVFHACSATASLADIGPHHRYTTGLLFDRVRGQQMRVLDRGNKGSGHGWTGATVLFWNTESSALDVVVASPPGAANYGVGALARTVGGDGRWESVGRHVFPASLYSAQMASRLGTRYAECEVTDQPTTTTREHITTANDGTQTPRAATIDKEENTTIVDGVPNVALLAGAAAVLALVVYLVYSSGKPPDPRIDINSAKVIPDGDFGSSEERNKRGYHADDEDEEDAEKERKKKRGNKKEEAGMRKLSVL